VEVRYDEGIASHIGPEPCAGLREDVSEASVGECIGQPLSRERVLFPGADTVNCVEGDMGRRESASACLARRGRRTWHVQTLLVREPGDLWIGHFTHPKNTAWMVRNGKVRSRSR